MPVNRFFRLLLVASLLAAAALLFFGQWTLTMPFTSFSWLSLGFFLLLTLGIFFLGKRAAASETPTSFVQAVIGALAAKLFGAVLLILLYDRLFEPESKWFLLPFFTLYLIYTILETYMLMKLSASKSPPNTL